MPTPSRLPRTAAVRDAVTDALHESSPAAVLLAVAAGITGLPITSPRTQVLAESLRLHADRVMGLDDPTMYAEARRNEQRRADAARRVGML